MFPLSTATQTLTRSLRPGASAALAAAALCASMPAFAADDDSPGLKAIEDFRAGDSRPKAVTNRFFLKENRFEISPIIGYVPNNPFAVRYVGGAILGFHFSETIAAQAQISYSPDLGENDLKGLVGVLLDRAFNAGADVGFQQPLDKVTLSAAFGVAWAPVYGKINLVGETVLNFDLYFVGGIGMLAKTNYFAVYADSPCFCELIPGAPANEVEIAPMVGTGMDFFLTQGMALKLDARMSLYIDNKPQYDPNEVVTEQRLYNNFIVGAGLGFYFPKMKTRLYNF